MREHIKVYTGNAITIDRLAQLLEEEKVSAIIKNHNESGRLAGFGTTGDSVELHVYDSDVNKAEEVFEVFQQKNLI